MELQTRREFAAAVTRGKNELKLTNPSNTPVTNLIENAVIEVDDFQNVIYFITSPLFSPYLYEVTFMICDTV